MYTDYIMKNGAVGTEAYGSERLVPFILMMNPSTALTIY